MYNRVIRLQVYSAGKNQRRYSSVIKSGKDDSISLINSQNAEAEVLNAARPVSRYTNIVLHKPPSMPSTAVVAIRPPPESKLPPPGWMTKYFPSHFERDFPIDDQKQDGGHAQPSQQSSSSSTLSLSQLNRNSQYRSDNTSRRRSSQKQQKQQFSGPGYEEHGEPLGAIGVVGYLISAGALALLTIAHLYERYQGGGWYKYHQHRNSNKNSTSLQDGEIDQQDKVQPVSNLEAQIVANK
ncbi:hypothetical protein MIR68_008196 [Amoeboaphelidium protococcarum]|nr:hypothetical protein MIR68_008196 [Amoeboaphelidium protococcarum]